MNKAILIGNLTRDPELRTTPSGISVCSFGIAVNRRMPNAQGVREADFFNIVVWRQQGENCAKYLSKGRKVGVIGQIQIRSYDAQDGTKHQITEIVADEVEFLSSQNPGEGRPRTDEIPLPPEPASFAGAGSSNAAPAASASPRPAAMTEVEEDDDLPF